MTRRDDRDAKDLARENQSLKRQLARLRRRLEKEGPPEADAEDDGDDEPLPELGKKCPKCGSTNLKRYTTPNKVTIVGCVACKKWRERVKT